MPSVPFTQENAMRCICGRCPVQANSQCSKEKQMRLKELMEKGKLPNPGDVPDLYCASGKAACKDLELNKMCICGSCPVWVEYELVSRKPTMHFCRDGKSR